MFRKSFLHALYALFLPALCIFMTICVNASGESTADVCNDPYYDVQWWFANMHVTTAWNQQVYTSDPVVIAVIDTGIDVSHPDLFEHIWTNSGEIPGNHKDDDRNGYIDDYYGWDFYNQDSSVCHTIGSGTSRRADSFDNDDHGTHIAGLLAATANNGVGIAGIASNLNVQIMCLKVFGGINGAGTTDALIEAIHYAEDNGADIVNASWNFDETDPNLKQTIRESNLLFICSAGNQARNVDLTPSYPCCYSLPNVVSVTSIDESNRFCRSFANYGAHSIHLAAPGKNILSTVISGYETLYGTSMSVPMVTGTAALVYGTNPSLSARDIKQILLSSTNENSQLTNRTLTGGQIDCAKAASQAALYQPTVDRTKPRITCKITRRRKSIKCKIKVTDRGGSGLRLVRYAKGRKKASYFQNGKAGKRLTKKTLTFRKNTYLTIYALDHQSNARVKTIYLRKKRAK